jgi:hypothetical protein
MMTMMDDEKREGIWCHSFRHLGILIFFSFTALQSLYSEETQMGKFLGTS